MGLARGSGPCDSILEPSRSQDGAEARDFSNEANVEASCRAIRKVEPELVIAGELDRSLMGFD